MSNVLVTGGSGFIGSHLIDRLLPAGHRIFNFDTSPPPSADAGSVWIRGDVLSADSMRQAVEQAAPQIVFHLAARTDIRSQNLETYATVYQGMRNLLETLQGCKSVRRLVHVSTQLVVGPGYLPASDEDFKPYSRYGEAKAIAERDLRALDPPFDWLIARPTNIWGPRHPFFAKSLWRYLRKGLYMHPVCEGPVVRSYGYVANAVDQLVSLAHAPAGQVAKRVFYISDPPIDSAVWLDAFSTCLTGRPARRVPKALLAALARAGDALTHLNLPVPLDSQRLMRMTTEWLVPLEPTLAVAGSPRVPLEEGVRQTVAWLRSSNPTLYGEAR